MITSILIKIYKFSTKLTMNINHKNNKDHKISSSIFDHTVLFATFDIVIDSKCFIPRKRCWKGFVKHGWTAIYTEKSQYMVAEMFKINQSMIYKWLKDKKNIFQQDATRQTRKVFWSHAQHESICPCTIVCLPCLGKNARKRAATSISTGYGVSCTQHISRTT